MSGKRLPVVVLISGNGSNLQTFIDGQRDGSLPIDIRAVISNRADAHGLRRAEDAGIHSEILDHRAYPNRASYDTALAGLVDRFAPGLIVLAGFMRLLSASFVERYTGRLINIHPSLLPAFRGLHTHRRALESGVREHGCSVHFVTPELDAGPVIAQAVVPVAANDTPETLQTRVQTEEHRLYPLAIRWIAEGRVTLRDGEVLHDGDRRRQPPRITPGTDTAAARADR